MRKKIFMLVSLTIIVGCSDEKLKELERLFTVDAKPLEVRASFCTIPANKVKSKLKFLFAMDKSTSNQSTDPDGSRRYTPLLSFLNNAVDDPTVYYSLINFSNEAGLANGLPSNGLMNDRQGFINIVTYESNPENRSPPDPLDNGDTNYLAALGKIQKVIEDDINAAKAAPEIESSAYAVFFISDGVPIVNGRVQSKRDILNAVDAVMALEFNSPEYVDQILLSTAYYYIGNPDIPPTTFDPDAKALLAEMADPKHGKGLALNFGAGQVIDFRQFAIPERNVKHNLRDIFFGNENAMWWNGDYLADSDGDAIPDKIEVQHGSYPLKVDSDGNGVSDGIEYFATGKPCTDSRCRPDFASAYLSCQPYEVAGATTRTFTDKDKDLLDDCAEKVILRSKSDNFDSNSDWIPDHLAFRRGIAFISGTSESLLDPDQDKLMTYYEIKYNTPPYYDNNRILGLKQTKFTLKTLSDDPVQTCYELKVDDLMTLGPDDLIRAYIFENTSIIDNKKFMRMGQKRATSNIVEFIDSDFK